MIDDEGIDCACMRSCLVITISILCEVSMDGNWNMMGHGTGTDEAEDQSPRGIKKKKKEKKRMPKIPQLEFLHTLTTVNLSFCSVRSSYRG